MSRATCKNQRGWNEGADKQRKPYDSEAILHIVLEAIKLFKGP